MRRSSSAVSDGFYPIYELGECWFVLPCSVGNGVLKLRATELFSRRNRCNWKRRAFLWAWKTMYFINGLPKIVSTIPLEEDDGFQFLCCNRERIFILILRKVSLAIWQLKVRVRILLLFVLLIYVDVFTLWWVPKFWSIFLRSLWCSWRHTGGRTCRWKT